MFSRKLTVDDFIIPNRNPRTNGGSGQTKSSAHGAMRRACRVARVRFEGCHLTRHTMTWARRGGAPADVLERVTHNAAGAIIDRYTHFDWAPLCRVVECIDYRLNEDNGGRCFAKAWFSRLLSTVIGCRASKRAAYATERYTHVQVDPTRAIVEARWESLRQPR